MGLNPLRLDLPPMSEVVRGRRQAAAASQLERQMAARRQETARVCQLARAYSAARRYAGASVSPQRADWPAMSTTYQTDIFRHLRQLRAESREMAKNVPHMKRFLGMLRRNVVGPAGIKLQVRARKRGRAGRTAQQRGRGEVQGVGAARELLRVRQTLVGGQPGDGD